MTLWNKRDDMIVHERDPFNAEPALAALDGHALTPIDTFYTRNHGPIPDPGEDSWQIGVDGLVNHPLSLSLAELRDGFSQQSVVATMQCAGNRRSGLLPVRAIPGEDPWRGGATGTARWTGVRLADVLAAAGVDSQAQHVAFSAPDVSQIPDPPQPYGSSIPMWKASSPEVLLAWAMNEAPLTEIHGAPIRVVVPGYIGARSVKWVNRVTVQCEPSSNYFQARAYRLLPPQADPTTAGPGDGISLGSVALNCEILRPGAGERVPAGPVGVSGYALAGDDRRVERVDVSADAGHTWRQADLEEQASPWSWRLWRVRLDLAVGHVTLVARAWDSTGATQPASPEHVWNPKGYANNSWANVTVEVVGPATTDDGTGAGEA